jgi:single-stranded-DNA-specific exonuclease
MPVPAPIARVLDSRGITGAARDTFLSPSSWSQMETPGELPGMTAVRDRILDAIRLNQPICLFGDYDADGVLSSAILYTTLRMLGGTVEVVLPRREDGYGLNVAAVKRFSTAGKHLIVTVDNGIAAFEPIRMAGLLGMDTVVIDHHHRQEETPDATAILWDPRYCAGGLALMTSWALLDAERGADRAAKTVESMSKLAAIATIGDVIPLVGVGRTLTRLGMASLARNSHAGLNRLLEVSGVRGGAPTSRQLAFGVCPRVNAASRMGDPNDALAVFLETDPAVAIERVNRLDELNKRRRDLQKILCQQMIERTGSVGNVCVAYNPSWLHGLVGIMAARAVEHYHVPAIVFGLDHKTGLAYGSARSVPGFNLVDALNACSGLLVKYGGHAAAAGVTIKPEFMDEFRAVLSAYIGSGTVEHQQVKAETHLELSEYSMDFDGAIRAMEPFGNGNPNPLFVIRNAVLGKAKPYQSTLTQGKHTVIVRHADDVELSFVQVERDYLVEATTKGLVLVEAA